MGYEYEVCFNYETTFIGAVVYTDESGKDIAIKTAIQKIWDSNGIDIDVKDCESVKVELTATIGGGY